MNKKQSHMHLHCYMITILGFCLQGIKSCKLIALHTYKTCFINHRGIQNETRLSISINANDQNQKASNQVIRTKQSIHLDQFE